MSRFHTFTTNESSDDDSDDREDGQLDDDCCGTDSQYLTTNTTTTIQMNKTLDIMDKKTDTKRPNRFSIWSNILLEEDLKDSMQTSMDINKRLRTSKYDRNCENYSFWTKSQLENKDNKEDNQEMSQTVDTNHNQSKKSSKKSSKKKKIRKNQKDFVTEMAHKLKEPKVDLLKRVFETIGESKMTELFSATLDVESSGGLMTLDGKRRRTPGGVFFQLLKNDKKLMCELTVL
ncbi:phosphorylated adapter RNA export protein-like [Oppia nitens]|uniref:phosphorylated adapter RNA export protein-like n=1 Tax=Oppia nitens TaxID=1686743 RepID=UPI0023DB18FB|nr:phosphorylated adapter RNA export protein-like [Oppia nitens]